MSTHDIRTAKDPDLRGTLAALQRAALEARKTAIRTNTHLVIFQDGQIVRIPPDELRKTLSGDHDL